MIREGTLKEISDGKLYTSNDMVKAGCNDCAGCSECCRSVGNTIVLDPYDIYMLTVNLKLSFMELLKDRLELNMVDGMILPNIAMRGEAGGCGFLDENGRCSIHAFRPGFCRLYPMGRYYEGDSFKYILLKDECQKPNKTKVKVKAFLGIDRLKEYEEYIMDWHRFQKETEKTVTKCLSEGKHDEAKAISVKVLEKFFTEPYDDGDFYSQYRKRRDEMMI